jgi:hypothetical protein
MKDKKQMSDYIQKASQNLKEKLSAKISSLKSTDIETDIAAWLNDFVDCHYDCKELEDKIQALYSERNRLAIAFAYVADQLDDYSAYVEKGTSEKWPIVYIKRSNGIQVSWHIGKKEHDMLFHFLKGKEVKKMWDGTYIGKNSFWLHYLFQNDIASKKKTVNESCLDHPVIVHENIVDKMTNTPIKSQFEGILVDIATETGVKPYFYVYFKQQLYALDYVERLSNYTYPDDTVPEVEQTTIGDLPAERLENIMSMDAPKYDIDKRLRDLANLKYGRYYSNTLDIKCLNFNHDFSPVSALQEYDYVEKFYYDVHEAFFENKYYCKHRFAKPWANEYGGDYGS